MEFSVEWKRKIVSSSELHENTNFIFSLINRKIGIKLNLKIIVVNNSE